MEPERLFSLLNLDAPGMEEVKAAVGAGDFVRAEKELLMYMRNRENVRTQIPWRKRTEHKGRYASKEEMLIGDSGTQCVMQNLNLDYQQWIDDCAQRRITAIHIWALVPPRQKRDGCGV